MYIGQQEPRYKTVEELKDLSTIELLECKVIHEMQIKTINTILAERQEEQPNEQPSVERT